MTVDTRAEEVRVFLLREEGRRMMLSGRPGAFTLPKIFIPAYSRHAEEISMGLRLFYELESYCLFTLPSDSARPPSHHYSFSCLAGKGLPPSGFAWADPASVAREDFKEDCDFTSLQTGYRLIEGCRADHTRGYFARPGWLEHMQGWIERQLMSRGMRLTGGWSQQNASATASLVRFETDSSAVWFKAAGEANRQELSITLYLASHLPEFLPPFVAIHPESHGWLACEVAGLPPSEHSMDAAWLEVADTLARFQQKTTTHAAGLLAAGCIDIRPQALALRIKPFLDVTGQLMAEQVKASPAPLTPQEIDSLSGILHDALGFAETLSLPSALVHLDFNLGNIIVGSQGVTFLDWAAGGIGHPFLTLEYLLEQLRTIHPASESLRARLTSTYWSHWRSCLEENALREAVRLAPLLAAFSYASSSDACRDSARRSDPGTAGHLRSMARRIKHEADQWTRRSRARLCEAPEP
jgi:hypothetical protein